MRHKKMTEVDGKSLGHTKVDGSLQDGLLAARKFDGS